VVDQRVVARIESGLILLAPLRHGKRRSSGQGPWRPRSPNALVPSPRTSRDLRRLGSATWLVDATQVPEAQTSVRPRLRLARNSRATRTRAGGGFGR